MATIYRVIDLSPPHSAAEFAAIDPAAALALFGVDTAGMTVTQIGDRVTLFALPGPVEWIVVHIRDQEN